jgi:hypothetical protein
MVADVISGDEAEHHGRWPVDDLRDLELHNILLSPTGA